MGDIILTDEDIIVGMTISGWQNPFNGKTQSTSKHEAIMQAYRISEFIKYTKPSLLIRFCAWLIDRKGKWYLNHRMYRDISYDDRDSNQAEMRWEYKNLDKNPHTIIMLTSKTYYTSFHMNDEDSLEFNNILKRIKKDNT